MDRGENITASSSASCQSIFDKFKSPLFCSAQSSLENGQHLNLSCFSNVSIIATDQFELVRGVLQVVARIPEKIEQNEVSSQRERAGRTILCSPGLHLSKENTLISP